MSKYIPIFFISFFCICQHLAAQVTGVAFSGRVLSEQQEPIIGASVILEYLPTATRYAVITDTKGFFSFPDIKSGGPYQVKIQSVGFSTFAKSDLFFALGSKTAENIVLSDASNTLTEVVVSIDLDKERKGSGRNFEKSELSRLPTLTNSIQDFTRLSSQANGNSFSGTNYRYNNLAIDGAGNNDAFGFVEQAAGAGGSQAAGTPGSLARAQPISLDAIQELQVAVAPFYVTMGNFTGGSLNAVTRSGTNKTSASAYTFIKNRAFTGRSADSLRTRISQFSDYLSGVSFGGALVKDKLFYFGNIEVNTRTEPAPFAAGTDGSAFTLTDMTRLADTIRQRYGYDVGSFGDVSLGTRNVKVFTRLDWNATERDQISFRHNFVGAQADHLTRSANIFNFGSQGFKHFSNTNSSVFEWRRRLSNQLHHKFILSHAFIDEHRQTVGAPFPHVEITYGTAGNIFAGQYREAAIFRTRQRTFELTENLSYLYNRHHLTLGTHHELYGIDYHFVTPWNGRWAYSSLDNFYANKPSRIRRTYNLSDNSFTNNYDNPSAAFQVLLSSVYAQDELSLLNNKLHVTVGVRLDGSIFPERPEVSKDVTEIPEFKKYEQQLSNKFALAPRFGFNYKIGKRDQLVLRGGTGIFVGRMPFAWLAYAFLYDGNRYGNIDYRPAGAVVPLDASVDALQALQGNFQREINLLDPNLRLPQVWRSNLGADIALGRGWSVGTEMHYTKTLQDIKFETLNLKPISVPLSTYDTRPYFSGAKVSPDFTSVFLVTNTTQGYRYNISAQVKKQTPRSNSSVSYTYGHSKDLANGVRVSPQANWEWNQTLDPNQPQLSYSNFDIRHRFVGTTSYQIKYKNKSATTLSLVYLATSGVPYSFVYAGDANRDGSPTNDLIYVPKSLEESGLVDIKNAAGQVTLDATTQWNNLDAYIGQDKYLRTRRGGYAERNGARTPWNQQLDMRIMHQIRLKNGHDLQFSFDFVNLSNLFSQTWGRQYFVPNTTNAGYAAITFLRVQDGKPQYRFDKPAVLPYQFDPINSRLQGQLGIKYML